MFPHYLVLIVGIMCFVMFMTEGSMLDWSGVFLNEERGVKLTHAGYGYSAFAVAMTVCRLMGDKIVMQIGAQTSIAFRIFLYFRRFFSCCFHSFGYYFIMRVRSGRCRVFQYCAAAYFLYCHAQKKCLSIFPLPGLMLSFAGILCGPAFIGFLAKIITLAYTFYVPCRSSNFSRTWQLLFALP